MAAVEWCEGYDYEQGDHVKSRCGAGVTTNGCLAGKVMVFRCNSASTCATVDPGTGSNSWTVTAQCLNE
jgi:hypothetical protein